MKGEGKKIEGENGGRKDRRKKAINKKQGKGKNEEAKKARRREGNKE